MQEEYVNYITTSLLRGHNIGTLEMTISRAGENQKTY